MDDNPNSSSMSFAATPCRSRVSRKNAPKRVDGAFTLRRGFGLDAGENVVVVEDVVTTGGSTREVLALVAEGAGNGDIARRLFLSDKTVRNYVSAILTKLGCDNRAQAIVLARDAGLGAAD